MIEIGMAGDKTVGPWICSNERCPDCNEGVRERFYRT